MTASEADDAQELGLNCIPDAGPDGSEGKRSIVTL